MFNLKNLTERRWQSMADEVLEAYQNPHPALSHN